MSEKKQPLTDILDELKNSYGKLIGLATPLVAVVITIVTFVETKPWHVIGMVVFVLLIFAFVIWRIYRRQQQTAEIEKLAETSGSAFRGLMSFEEGDAETFFGREADIGTILQKVCHSEFRFGVLTGESGCGKTSLLKPD
jgi:ABC-type transport system involved in cytochrome bd biosynthesis fused ATPase/permease subunit